MPDTYEKLRGYLKKLSPEAVAKKAKLTRPEELKKGVPGHDTGLTEPPTVAPQLMMTATAEPNRLPAGKVRQGTTTVSRGRNLMGPADQNVTPQVRTPQRIPVAKGRALPLNKEAAEQDVQGMSDEELQKMLEESKKEDRENRKFLGPGPRGKPIST